MTGCTTGYFGFRICPESSATAASKAHDSSPGSCCNIDPMFMEMLCCRRKFLLRCYMEDTSNPTKVTTLELVSKI